MPIKATSYPEVQVTEEIKKYFDSRSQLGWDKYGKTMDRTDLSPVEWCTHLIDELGDALQYSWRLRQTLTDLHSEILHPESLKTCTNDEKSEKCFQSLSVNHEYKNLFVGQKVFCMDDDKFELHAAEICGFVLDPEDGNLVVIQTGYNWVAVSLSVLYEQIN
jgi:hypothetical protein